MHGRTSTPRRWKIDAAMASLTFAVLLIIGIFALTALLVAISYRDQLTRAESSSAAAAHIVSVQTQWLVEASLQVLERIHDRLEEASSWPGPSMLGDINNALEGLPGHVRITVYSPEGDIRLTNAENPQMINVADRRYFSALAGGEQIHISSMLIDRADGVPAFVIARRLETGDAFSGVAAISVSSALMEDFWHSLDLSPGSAISIVHADGWLVARYPLIDQALYLGDHELFTEHLSRAPAGVYHSEASPADGLARIVGYRTVPNQPLVAVSAASTDFVVTRFWRNVLILSGLLVPIAIALLLAVFWLERILQRDRLTREKLANAVEQNQLLFREIHHRVKNNLQAVSSLVQLQPVPAAVKQEMGRRIAAMVAVHEHIYRTDQFEQTEVSDYIGKLVSDIVTGFETEASVETEISPVVVHRDHAMPLGLIVNEVLCNALKHAFPEGRKGTVRVALHPLDDERAVLRIEDDGVGFDPQANSTGMGRRLIAGLGRQIGGEITLEGETGSRFEIVFPLARQAA